MSSRIEVCPMCDIAGCVHIRNKTKKIDAVNARDSEPKAFHPPASKEDMKVYQSIADNYNKTPDQSAYIKRLEDALKGVLHCGEDRDEAGMSWEEIATSRSQYISKKNLICAKALASKESIDG